MCRYDNSLLSNEIRPGIKKTDVSIGGIMTFFILGIVNPFQPFPLILP